MALKTSMTDNNKVVEIDCRANKTFKNLFKSKKSKNNKSKNLTYMLNIKATGKPIFLTLNAKKVFNNL